MLLYLGIGCDGAVAYTLHKLRKKFPYIFLFNKLTRLYYAFSHFSHWFPELWKGSQQNKLKKMHLILDGKPI